MKSFIAYKFSGESEEVLRPMLTAVTEAFKQKEIEPYCTFFDYDEVRDRGKTAGEIMAHAFSVIDNSDFLFVILASEEKAKA